MKNFIKKMVLALVVMVTSLVSSSGAVYAARPTDGWSNVNCTGRWTLATRQRNTTKLTVYMCSNGYAFTHVSSTRRGGIGAYLYRSNPNGSVVQWNGSSYAATTNMLYLYRGSCFNAYANSIDAVGSNLYFNFCIN